MDMRLRVLVPIIMKTAVETADGFVAWDAQPEADPVDRVGSEHPKRSALFEIFVASRFGLCAKQRHGQYQSKTRETPGPQNCAA
jgi:hypothetical protein